jgi:hypothetical protein
VNVLGIGGPPGVGKSEVMREVLALLHEQGFEREDVKGTIQVDGRNVPVNAVELRAHGTTVIVLGRYDEGDTFPGTDRLSMAVQPAAEDLIARLAGHTARQGTSEQTHVVFEGDRLFSRSFLLSCAATPGVTVHACVLSTTAEQLEARRKGRGSNQAASWLKGRTSKVDGIVRWLKDSGEPVHELINAPGLARACAAHVLDLLGLCAGDACPSALPGRSCPKHEPTRACGCGEGEVCVDCDHEVCERCQDEGCAECQGAA